MKFFIGGLCGLGACGLVSHIGAASNAVFAVGGVAVTGVALSFVAAFILGYKVAK